MKILALETSCDETAVSLINFKKTNKNSFVCEYNEIISQIDFHKEYGGVYPNVAKREHRINLPLLISRAAKEKNDDKDAMSDIDIVAVTNGPGLAPALWVGVESAKDINKDHDKGIITVNHMEGHIYASTLDKIREDKYGAEYNIKNINYPAIALLISGGHTELVLMQREFVYKKIGYTLDDAVGEAFDKVARSLGLPYPGGPFISKLASIARKTNSIVREELRLPRPMINSKDLNFSFSGLKTSVINKIDKYNIKEDEINTFCMEFENAVTDVIVKKTREALYLYNAKSLIVGGGVSANNNIRDNLVKICSEDNINIFLPDKDLSTDNSLMIAATAFRKYMNSEDCVISKKEDVEKIKAEPNLSL